VAQTVLVVDDEPTVVELVASLLRRAGYEVVPAVGPHEALEALAHSRDAISLVLADIVMPEINGLELVKRMRKMRRGLPYILMTGFSVDILREYHKIGVEDTLLLHKPFTTQTLLAEIRKALP